MGCNTQTYYLNMYFSAFSLILVLAFRFIQTLLIHTLIALVVFGLLCKYIYCFTELRDQQLNKQLSVFSWPSSVTFSLPQSFPNRGLLPFWCQGLAVLFQLLSARMMVMFIVVIDAQKQHFFWQMNAVMKMLLFQRMFSELCFRKGEPQECVWLKLVIPLNLALYLHNEITCLSLRITARNPNILLRFYLSLTIGTFSVTTDPVPHFANWPYSRAACGLAGRAGGQAGISLAAAACTARPHAALVCSVISGVLWWLHYDYRNDPSTELETEKENVKFLLGYAIFSTIVTVSSVLP